MYTYYSVFFNNKNMDSYFIVKYNTIKCQNYIKISFLLLLTKSLLTQFNLKAGLYAILYFIIQG